MEAQKSFTVALPRPYLLFLGDITIKGYVKTALGLLEWMPELCIGEVALDGCTVSTGLPRLTPAEAYAKGARAIVIGAAPVGGVLPRSWDSILIESLEVGLDIISGLHSSLSSMPILNAAVARTGRQFIEVRRPPPNIPIGAGRKRSGQRLLTMGTDCIVGKKYTAIALARAFQQRGVDARFRATGQTGIMIAGEGLPLDAVPADFMSGAAETLSPDAPPSHWDVVEGQGSLFHPSYAGLTVGMLHGTQPDVIVLCHAVGRTQLLGNAAYPVPSLTETIDLALRLGRLTNPAIRCAGVSLNTSGLDEAATAASLAEVEAETGLPAADPIKGGTPFTRLVDACLMI